MKRIYIPLLLCLIFFFQGTFGQNLLTNGDFESGFDDWENVIDETAIGEFTLETSDVYAGSGAMKLVITQLGVNDWSVQSMHTAWPSVKDTEYKLTLYAKSALAGTAIRAIQQLNEYDAMDFSLSTKWTQYEWIFKAKENNQQLKFHFHDDGTIFIDNIVIQKNITIYPTDNTLEVDVNTKYQTMEGFGGGLCFYENWVAAHPSKEEMYKLLYDDLGINLLRLRNAYRYESNFTSFNTEFVQKGNEHSNKGFKVLLCSWSPPANLKSNNNLNNGTLAKVNGQFVYQDFAQYWKDALDAYKNIGVVPDWIGIQNEPDFLTDKWETCKFTPTETNDYPGFDVALENVYNTIKSIENPPLILGAEELGIGYNNFNNYSDPIKDKSYLWAYGYHLYHGGDPNLPDSYNSSFRNIANNYADRPNIMTEYSKTGVSWFNTAWLVSNNISVGNASAYFYWDLIWPDAGLINIDNPWDVANWSNEKGYQIEPQFYAIKHFSKFVDVGYERIECNNSNEGIKSSVFISPDKKVMVMVLLNVAGHTVTTNVVPDGWSSDVSGVYQSVEGNYFKYLGNVPSSGIMELPSKSVTTIVYGESIQTDPQITVTPGTLSLEKGSSYQLKAKVTPDDGTNYAITWSSSDPGIVSVNSSGVVTGIAQGDAIVSATLASTGKSASCKITVLPGGTYYSLTATTKGSGTVTANPDGMLYLTGTEVTLTASPAKGWRFDSWSGDAAGSDPVLKITMDANKDIVANFVEIPDECTSYELVSLPHTHSGAGVLCLEVRGEITQVNSWGCDQFMINGVNYCGQYSSDIPVPANGIYYIHYISSVAWSHVEISGTNSTGETFTLTVKTSERGSVIPAGGTFASGTTVNLKAIPDDGCEFVGWGGDASGSNTEVAVKMDADKTVTATFRAISADAALVVTIVGEGTVNPSGGLYPLGEVVTLTATPALGYYFDSWGGDLSGNGNPQDITMDSNKSITASFSAEGNDPCKSPVSRAIPIDQSGVGEYCWFTTDEIGHVNSWNMDLVEINHVDFTNTWSNSMPEKINDGYYIYYNGLVAWSHFEAVAVKSAKNCVLMENVHPNPFTHSTYITLPQPEKLRQIQVLDYMGRKIEVFSGSEIKGTMEIGQGYLPGMYIILISSGSGSSSYIIAKE